MLDDPVYSLKEYLALAKISRSTFYKEMARGNGVEFLRRGDKIYVRHSSHLRHLERRERAAAAEQETKRAAVAPKGKLTQPNSNGISEAA